MSINPYLKLETKIIPKWLIYLNVKPKTVKPLEEHVGENFCDLELG